MLPSLCLTLLAVAWSVGQAPSGLEQAVRDYWTALSAGDKAAAMRFVHPDDLNKFLNRHEPPIRSWKLSEMETLSEREVAVTVTISRLFPTGSVLSVPAREVWQWVDSGWRVRIQSLEDYQRRLDQFLKSRSELPHKLDVLPRQIKILAHSDQPGVIVIRNGLQTAVQVEGLGLDRQRFEVSKWVEAVQARTVGRIAIRYIGEEAQSDLHGSLVLRLRVGGERRRFEIPVLYNYVDPILDWLRARPAPPPGKPPA